MKKYFNVSFQYSESVYCANIAHAETAEDVAAHYSKYEWVKITEAQDYEVESAQRKGMPVVECDHIDTTEPTDTAEAAALAELNARANTRSAWGRGVKEYAAELLEGLFESIRGGWFDLDDLAAPRMVERGILNGAQDWEQYSWGGCSLIYNADIAERLCNPSELKRTGNGAKKPNAREEWLDTQARALFQAAQIVKECAKVAAESIEQEDEPTTTNAHPMTAAAF